MGATVISISIHVDGEVYAAILKAKTELETATGRPQSMAAALRSLLAGLRGG